MHAAWFDIIFLSVVGLAEIGLAMFFFFKYQRSPAIIAMGYLALTVGLWVFFTGFGVIFPLGGILVDIFGRLTFVFAAFIFPILLLFIVNYPIPSPGRDLQAFFLLLLPTFISVLVFSKSVIVGFDSSPKVSTIYGNSFWVYVIYMLAVFALSLCFLIYKTKRTAGQHRKVLLSVLWGLIISGTIGVLNNLFLPFYFSIEAINWLGSGASLVWLGITAWVILV